MQKLLTKQEAAEILRISIREFDRYRTKGKYGVILKCYKMGKRTIRVSMNQIGIFLEDVSKAEKKLSKSRATSVSRSIPRQR